LGNAVERDLGQRESRAQDWPEEIEFICRGKEQAGQSTFDQDSDHHHLIQLFVIGVPPRSPTMTTQDTIDWGSNPRHSYVNDGTGVLSAVAHPNYALKASIGNLSDLTAIEISHSGDCGWVDRLWDELQVERFDRGDPMLWGFAGDDTHSTADGQIDLSWLGIKIVKHNTYALKQAMRNGAFYASNGIRIRDFRVDGPTITVECEQACEVRWLKSGQYYNAMGIEARKRHSGRSPSDDSTELIHLVDPMISAEIGPNRCVKVECDVRESSYTLNTADGTDDPMRGRYARCIVLNSHDMQRLRKLVADGASVEEVASTNLTIRKACSMPFRILSANTLESPYPENGTWVRGMTHNHSDLPAHRLGEVKQYHAAYRARGQEANFETGYSYWFVPYIFYPEKGTPIVESLDPDRCNLGTPPAVRITGKNFRADSKVLIGESEAEVIQLPNENTIICQVPPDLPAGIYDATVIDTTTPYQHTLSEGFTVQPASACRNGWTRFTTYDGLPDHDVYRVCWVDGRLWAGTRNGLAWFDGKRFVSAGGGLINVEAVDMDSEGNLWACGWDGVYRRTGQGWKLWGKEDGLEHFFKLHDILCISSGEVLVTHYRNGCISVFDGRQWHTEYFTIDGEDNVATFLAQALDGSILAGSKHRVITQRISGEWRPADLPPLQTNCPRRIYFDPQGKMVLAAAGSPRDTGGIHILEGDRWRIISQEHGLPDHRISALAFQDSGAIWAATGKGIAHIDPHGDIQVHTMLDSGLSHDYASDLCITPEGDLWVATGRGVARYRL